MSRAEPSRAEPSPESSRRRRGGSAVARRRVCARQRVSAVTCKGVSAVARVLFFQPWAVLAPFFYSPDEYTFLLASSILGVLSWGSGTASPDAQRELVHSGRISIARSKCACDCTWAFACARACACAFAAASESRGKMLNVARRQPGAWHLTLRAMWMDVGDSGYWSCDSYSRGCPCWPCCWPCCWPYCWPYCWPGCWSDFSAVMRSDS
jgi:hypothetical protein